MSMVPGRRVLLGRVLLLSYMSGDRRQYRGSSAPLKVQGQQKEIGAACDWYAITDSAAPKAGHTKLDKHHIDGFYSIRNYIATVNAPDHNFNQILLDNDDKDYIYSKL